MRVRVCRFHSAQYVFEDPARLHRSFLDSERLVVRHYRFAGERVNPGIYFSLSTKACISEILHSHPELNFPAPSEITVQQILNAPESQREPLAFFMGVGEFNNLLDLTDPGNLQEVLRRCGPELIIDRRRPTHTADIILALADAQQAGNFLTEVVGRYAYRSGFNGIVFFSARAINDFKSDWAAVGRTYREALEEATFGYGWQFDELLQEMQGDCSNLALFSGAYFMSCLREFYFEKPGDEKAKSLFRLFKRSRKSSPKWTKNLLFEKPVSEIEQLMVKEGGLTRDEIDTWCAAIFRGYQPHEEK